MHKHPTSTKPTRAVKRTVLLACLYSVVMFNGFHNYAASGKSFFASDLGVSLLASLTDRDTLDP